MSHADNIISECEARAVDFLQRALEARRSGDNDGAENYHDQAVFFLRLSLELKHADAECR